MERTSLERVRRGEAQWREILKRQVESGIPVEPFCKAEGISSGCFYRWRRRLSDPSSSAFLELAPELLNRGRVRAELDLGQGMVFRIFG